MKSIAFWILKSLLLLYTHSFFLYSSPLLAQNEQDLVAHYPLNGNANDESSHGNNGKLTNISSTQNRDNEPGQACQFSGGGYITIPNSPINSLKNQMTLAMWFFYEQQQSSLFYTLLEKTNPEFGGHSRYGMWVYNGGTIEVCVEPDNCPGSLCQRCLDSSEKLTKNTWHHVAGTYDGSSLKVYINGQLSAERSYAKSSGISQTEFEIFMGTDLYGGNQFLTGRLDDVRIYSAALNASVIQSLYLGENIIEEEENEEDKILSIKTKDELNLYPTYLSTNGSFSILTKKRISSFQILSTNGKTLINQNDIASQTISLAGYGLNPGMYFIKIMTVEDTLILRKILLK